MPENKPPKSDSDAQVSSIVQGIVGSRPGAAQRRLTPTRPVTQRRRQTSLVPAVDMSDFKPATSRGGGDDGLSVGDFFKSALSPLTWTGSVIWNVPKFLTKVGQTGLGVAETVADVPFEAIESFGGPDILTTRFEADFNKADELGLKGWEKFKYGMQRSFPIAAPFAESVGLTAGSLAEVGTLGQVDLGEPGVDYYTALKQGRLGAKLLEDAGNVLVVGRVAGLGNLASKGAASLEAAGRPGLAKTVSTTGRLADEPIGETARQTARLIGSGAKFADMPKLADSMARIAAAVPTEGVSRREAARNVAAGITDPALTQPGIGPLRTAVNEALSVRQRVSVEKFDELSRRINGIKTRMDELPIDDLQRQVLDDERIKLEKQRDLVLRGTGWVGKAVKKIMEYQRRAEAVRTNLGGEIASIKRDGIIRESPEALRERSANMRGVADSLELDGRTADARRMRELADYTDYMASVKEADPQAFEGPLPDWVSPVVIAFLTQTAQVALREIENGKSFEEVASILTPAGVGPDAKMNNYRWAATDVEQIYRYATGQLSDAERLMVDQLSLFYRAWYENYNASQLEGIGGNQPIPYTYRQKTPEPKFLLKELRSGRFPKSLAKKVINILDEAVVEVMGAILPEVAEQLGFIELVSTPMGLIARAKNVDGAFAKLAKLDYNDPLFKMVNVILAGAYDRLLAAAPEIMRDPMIFPPVMRNMMFPEQRLLGVARAEDIDQIAAVLARVSTQFGDLLETRTIDAVTRDIEQLRTAPKRYYKKSLRRMQERLDSVLRSLRNRRERLEALRAEKGPEWQRRETELLTRVIEAEQALDGIRATLDAIEKDARRVLGEDVTPAGKIIDDAQRENLEARAQVLQTLLDSDVARQELDAILAQLNGTTLDQALEVRPLTVEQKAELRGKLKRTASARNAPVTEETPQGVRVELLRGSEKRGLGRLASAQRSADRVRAKLESVRERHARLDEAENVALTGLEGVQAVGEELGKPVGPQLLTGEEAPIYLPGGLTAGTRTASRIPTELRQTGAAPQLTGSYERMRETDLRPLALTEVGRRLSEILNQVQRNQLVEELVKDPIWARTTSSLLGDDLINTIKEQARNEVLAEIRQPGQTSGLVPTSAGEIEAAIKIRTGELLNREIQARGYEAVSPVKVNDDATHEALGNLLDDVSVDKVDENTFLMRTGLRKRITQQYVYKDTSSVAPRIQQLFDRIGVLTSGWKSYILPFSLRWQVGDAVSNVLNAWVRGDVMPGELGPTMLEVARRLREQGGDFNRSIEGSVSDPLIATLLNAGLQTRGQKLADLVVNRTGSSNMPIEDLQIRGPLKRFRQGAFRFNEVQNQIARVSLAIVKLEETLQAMGRSIDEIDPAAYIRDAQLREAIDNAVSSTNEALGAFSELSPFEKNVVRKIYPFWSWVKFINKAAVQMAIDNPERVLFMGTIGSLVTEPDDNGFLDFLQGSSTVGNFLVDSSFLNPYEDAVIFSRSPIDAFVQQATGLSPVIMTPLRAAGAIEYYTTGKQRIPFGQRQRPGYLEGRPGASNRRVGDLLGELTYMGVKDLVPPLRRVFDVPVQDIPVLSQILTSNGRLRGTDVSFGNVPRFQQGSPRLSGAFSKPRLGPVASVVSAGLGTFGIPFAPVAEVEQARRDAQEQRQRDAAAKRRRAQERKGAKL